MFGTVFGCDFDAAIFAFLVSARIAAVAIRSFDCSSLELLVVWALCAVCLCVALCQKLVICCQCFAKCLVNLFLEIHLCMINAECPHHIVPSDVETGAKATCIAVI